MAWETVIVGELKLKEGISMEGESEILKDFENALECKLRKTKKSYEFRNINWSSHVEGRKIKEVIEKWGKYIDYFDCEIYYLSKPDEMISFERGKWVICYVY